MKGISPRNLRYMRNFAVAYPHFLQQPAAKLNNEKEVQALLAPSNLKGKLPTIEEIEQELKGINELKPQ